MNTSSLSPRMRLVLGALALGASLLPGLAQAAPDARCPWLGISPACDRQIQAAPPAGAAINTAHPNDIGMDSYNVPPVASVRARPPAPACPFGYQSGPSFDTSSWTWRYSCVPQTAQPAASACPNGFASGPTFNPGTNSWNYTCLTTPWVVPCSAPEPSWIGWFGGRDAFSIIPGTVQTSSVGPAVSAALACHAAGHQLEILQGWGDVLGFWVAGSPGESFGPEAPAGNWVPNVNVNTMGPSVSQTCANHVCSVTLHYAVGNSTQTFQYPY